MSMKSQTMKSKVLVQTFFSSARVSSARAWTSASFAWIWVSGLGWEYAACWLSAVSVDPILVCKLVLAEETWWKKINLRYFYYEDIIFVTKYCNQDSIYELPKARNYLLKALKQRTFLKNAAWEVRKRFIPLSAATNLQDQLMETIERYPSHWLCLRGKAS